MTTLTKAKFLPREQSTLFPAPLRTALEVVFKTSLFTIHPLAGGIQPRTFLVSTNKDFWVVRVDPAPATGLQRALAAQQQAQAAGFPTPALVTRDHTITNGVDYYWSVEEFVQGAPFDPASFDALTRAHIARQVGTQLRKLHRVELPAFGLLPPNAADQAPTLAIWLNTRRARLERARSLLPNLANLPERLTAALATLQTYRGPSCLCHGALAGANLLVHEQQLAATVGWEQAQGADPALDFGWWYFQHNDEATLTAMIEGYAPADATTFTQRVLAYALIHALETLLLYQSEENAQGSHACREKLQQYCSQVAAPHEGGGEKSKI
ncbi:MAG: aminoglycoside phosphotransferase family protein [Caldilineaceae bacterium]